ncbi:hypothetical protein [uncultured Mediterranean phage uvMED]|nr:hypothetical protein [uncultured Mediterranean phage uvMED]|tara:strand:+ start:1157 stop:1420 length:264 start_codon:yes stop_codon:yes gene_type:complete
MAYSASGLHRIGGASGVNLWIYQTTDAIATVNSAGYFNSSANMLNVRDLIIVMDTNVPTTNFCTVLSNTGSVVDVSDGTAVAETDGD